MRSLCFLCIALCLTSPAWAKSQTKAEKVAEMNRLAMEDYDILDFEGAKKRLTEALVEIKKGKLETAPVAAETHLYLGIVYAALDPPDMDSALLEFVSAIEIDEESKLPPDYKTPELQQVFDDAKAQVKESQSTEEEVEVEPPVDEVQGLLHVPVDDAPGGQPITITAKVGDDVKAKQVVLYYRGEGASDFEPVVMKNQGGVDYAAEIPAEATTGVSVHYYIVAKNAGGKVVASAGDDGSPNIVALAQASGTSDDAIGEDSEDPFDDGPHRGTAGTVSKSATHAADKSWFLAVKVGTGGGYVSGKAEVSEEQVSCCVAPAPLHVRVEVGHALDKKTAISLYGQLGLPLGADVPRAATAAPAGFLRLTYAMSKLGEGVYLHGDVGGGFIRHTIKLRSDDPMFNNKTDTFASGPVFVCGGAGWMAPLSSAVRFDLDTNIEMGIPIVTEVGAAKTLGFAINVDVTAGLTLAF